MVSKVGIQKIVIEYRILLENETTESQWQVFWQSIRQEIRYRPLDGEKIVLQLYKYKDGTIHILAAKILAETHSRLCELGHPPDTKHAVKLWKKLLSVRGAALIETKSCIKKLINELDHPANLAFLDSLKKLVD